MSNNILEQLTKGEVVFTAGNDRVRITRGEYSEHPWAMQDMACQLICWSGNVDVHFGVDPDEDICGEVRNEDLSLVESYKDFKVWLDDIDGNDDDPCSSVNRTMTGFSGDPYYILYIRADRYGFMDTSEKPSGHGALVITKQMYLDQVDSDFDGTVDELVAKMKEIAKSEAETLMSWYDGSVFTVFHEQDNDTPGRKPFENPVKVVEVYGDFYCIGQDYQEMFGQMCDSLDDTDNENLKQIIEQMQAA